MSRGQSNKRARVTKLRPPHHVFIREYLANGLIGTDAYRAAYPRVNERTAGVNASRLLKEPVIAAEIAKRSAKVIEKAELSAELVLKAIRRKVLAVAEGDLRKLFDEKGAPLPLHKLSQVEADLIGGYEIILKNAKAGDGVIDEVLKVKLTDAAKYVEMGAKYHKLLIDVVEVHDAEESIKVLQKARDRAKLAKKL